MSVGKAKTDLANLFNHSNIVTKHTVEADDSYEEPVIVVKLQLTGIADNTDASELLRVTKQARALLPKSYSLRLTITCWM